MPDQTEQSQNTFIVRFWWEWQGERSHRTTGWRGRIEHLQSSEEITFSDTRKLLAFIECFDASLESKTNREMSAKGGKP